MEREKWRESSGEGRPPNKSAGKAIRDEWSSQTRTWDKEPWGEGEGLTCA